MPRNGSNFSGWHNARLGHGCRIMNTRQRFMLVQTAKRGFVQGKERDSNSTGMPIIIRIGVYMYFMRNFTCPEVFQPVSCSSMFEASFLLPKYLIVL